MVRSLMKLSWSVQGGGATGNCSPGVLVGAGMKVGVGFTRVGGIYGGTEVAPGGWRSAGLPAQADSAPGRKMNQPSAITANLNG
jgi:hypothetical protein